MFDQAPNNLPTEPEDILADADANVAPAASGGAGSPPAADAAGSPLSGMSASGAPSTALAAGRLRPTASAVVGSDFLSDAEPQPMPSAARRAQPASEDMQSDSDVEITPPILNKRNVFIIIVAVLVILIAGGAFLVWRSSARRTAVPAPAAQPQTEAPAANEPSANENTQATILVQPSATTTTEAPQPTSPAVDADGDGLTDQQEIQYGTDPQKADTDGDNLTDYEEIFIWHTNPLNPDTDGDGYSDGQEVKNGFNPNGSGKLLNIPTTASSSKP
ncbi:MAG: hypothetical protein HY981_02800 [Candidatus Magasanikbacteria bacterium]|nr:hypothetical protein [Candidatus Magasanikbacteria bacterium]